ncbi:MAG TPA: Do family serine endopeptidase [Hyphomicrobium sp.]|nr:Do family serine endopeptidase [Hyphomicrobium sp.]
MQGLSARSGGAWGLGAALSLLILGSTFASRGAAAETRGPTSVAPIAEELIEAVVNVSTSQAIKGPQGLPLPSVPKGSPYHEYFDDFFDHHGGPSPQDRMVSSLGSGFIVDGKEGIIVTNNHVIDGAEEIQINLHDGTKLKAELVGKDTKTDIALLKVNPSKELKAVKFGSSAAMRVGDWVMAIGNPFGLGGSVTLGIISAKARNINSGPYDDYLQTDASINKGNSGGPLFNMDGQVIGVNTAIISPTGGSIGIGFAVPADVVAPVVDQLRQFKEVRRGWLGVKIQTVSDEVASSLGIPENSGALVAAVTPDGPAAKGGVQSGDIIVKFDKEPVDSMRSLPRLVARAPIDQKVDVEILRKGQKMTLQVTVGRLSEDEDVKAELGDGGASPKGMVVLGLKLSALTDELRQKYGIAPEVTGAVVDEVDPKSPAAKSIKAGDVIVQVANEPVTGPQDVAKRIDTVKKTSRKDAMLEVEDGKGSHRFITVPVD